MSEVEVVEGSEKAKETRPAQTTISTMGVKITARVILNPFDTNLV